MTVKPTTTTASRPRLHPRPILKTHSSPPSDLSLSLSLSPDFFPPPSAALPFKHPHSPARVHFPPTPSLIDVQDTHSPFVYDRAPIVVSPNACRFPERGGRVYEYEYECGREFGYCERRRCCRGEAEGVVDPKGSYFHPRAFEVSELERVDDNHSADDEDDEEEDEEEEEEEEDENGVDQRPTYNPPPPPLIPDLSSSSSSSGSSSESEDSDTYLSSPTGDINNNFDLVQPIADTGRDHNNDNIKSFAPSMYTPTTRLQDEALAFLPHPHHSHSHSCSQTAITTAKKERTNPNPRLKRKSWTTTTTSTTTATTTAGGSTTRRRPPVALDVKESFTPLSLDGCLGGF